MQARAARSQAHRQASGLIAPRSNSSGRPLTARKAVKRLHPSHFVQPSSNPEERTRDGRLMVPYPVRSPQPSAWNPCFAGLRHLREQGQRDKTVDSNVLPIQGRPERPRSWKRITEGRIVASYHRPPERTRTELGVPTIQFLHVLRCSASQRVGATSVAFAISAAKVRWAPPPAAPLL